MDADNCGCVWADAEFVWADADAEQTRDDEETQINRTRGEDVRELPLVNSCQLPTAVTTWYLTVNSRATQAKHYKVLNRFTQLLCQLLGRWLSDATN